MASGITLKNANGGTLNIEYQGTATGTKTVVIPEVNGEVATFGAVTSTEFGYLDGVTAAIQPQIDAKAPLASPVFIGNPTAPTPAVGDNDTSIATTAFTVAEIANRVGVANSALVKTALNAGGTAPIYASRAWVYFNAVGAVSILGSGNVSSITDNAVGDFTVNFTTAMPDTNYCPLDGMGRTDTSLTAMQVRSMTTSSFNFQVHRGSDNTLADNPMNFISVFR